MQNGSNEPENYSIDEMMERLKKNPSSSEEDQGELVTRVDGTQVIKMRKRKRRSRQPRKEREKIERKRKFARMLACMVLCLAVIGVFAGGIIYSNSGPFRTALVENINAATGAEAELRQFRMNPTGANADHLRLTWPGGSPIESIQSRGLRAGTSIRSFFGGSFSGEELTASEGTLTWRVPDSSQPRRIAATEDGNVMFSRISVTRFHLMPGDGLPRIFGLRNSEASFYPNTGTAGQSQMRLNGGELRVSGLPDLRMDRALIEFPGDEVNLVFARMFHGAEQLGEFLLSGTLRPLDTESTAILTAEASSFRIEGLVGDRMSRVIVGRIDSGSQDGASSLSIPSADPSSGVFELHFRSSLNSPIQIKGFNFLAELAVLLEEPWFEQPYFDSNVTGTIRRSGGAVELRDLHAEHRNRMALRGNLRMEERGRLTGKIDIGLSPALVTASHTRRLDPVISEASGGYRWISIEIGGNINAPTDNFMSIVDNPPSRTATPPSSDNSGGTSFEDLTRPR